jgi:hypothetical protein
MEYHTKNLTWLIEWYVIALLVVIVLFLAANAHGKSKGKTVLIVKDCGKALCADPILVPRLVLKQLEGHTPVPGQVLRCNLRGRMLQCDDSIAVEVDSVMLQSE